MQDVQTNFEVDGKVYPLVFNLNVMESIQQEYGSLDAWGDLTDGDAYAKKMYLQNNPTAKTPWEKLEDDVKARYKGEPDAKAVIFGFTEMINEGIDIANDDLDIKQPYVTKKQVGRLITKYGLTKATKKLNKTVVESAQTPIKNE